MRTIKCGILVCILLWGPITSKALLEGLHERCFFLSPSHFYYSLPYKLTNLNQHLLHFSVDDDTMEQGLATNTKRRSIFGDVRSKEKMGKTRVVTAFHLEYLSSQNNNNLQQPNSRHKQPEKPILRNRKSSSMMSLRKSEDRLSDHCFFRTLLSSCTQRTGEADNQSIDLASSQNCKCKCKCRRVQFKQQILMHVYYQREIIEMFWRDYKQRITYFQMGTSFLTVSWFSNEEGNEWQGQRNPSNQKLWTNVPNRWTGTLIYQAKKENFD